MTPPAFLYTQVGTILTFPTDARAENFQWAAFLTTPERPRMEWDEYRTSGDAIRDLKKEWSSITCEPIKSLLDNLTTDNLLVWAPYQIPDIPSWHTKRVCLLGDSCHAISPSAGQGTAQALEDVGLLARLLSNKAALAKGYPALFEHYEKARKARMLEGWECEVNDESNAM
jgi:2-polyprenyl-6-methoxyphenol hydroxylase-like FAD-dependent oxidoreductase